MDLNCDGRVNFCDQSVWLCIQASFGMDPTCCDLICGSCCIDGTACAETTLPLCEDPPPDGAGGIYQGDGTICPVQNAAVIDEPSGEVFVHHVGPDVKCPPGKRSTPRSGPAGPGPFIDAWVSHENAVMCQNFGVADSPEIPAGFFGPGSDPFTGSICMRGVPLGDPQFPNADTLIQRSADPFDRCDLPSETPVTVDIEIVELSLESVSPITVTYNGGQDPEEWDVVAGLSDIAQTMGSLTATKIGCNGGTNTNILPVQAKFTFTNVLTAAVEILDTGVEGIAPVELAPVEPLDWVSDIDPSLDYSGDLSSDFHPGVQDPNPALEECDCNGNAVRDKCDIENQTSTDNNGNGVPDECDAGVPAVSEWGLLVMAVLLLVAGTLGLMRREARPE